MATELKPKPGTVDPNYGSTDIKELPNKVVNTIIFNNEDPVSPEKVRNSAIIVRTARHLNAKGLSPADGQESKITFQMFDIPEFKNAGVSPVLVLKDALTNHGYETEVIELEAPFTSSIQDKQSGLKEEKGLIYSYAQVKQRRDEELMKQGEVGLIQYEQSLSNLRSGEEFVDVMTLQINEPELIEAPGDAVSQAEQVAQVAWDQTRSQDNSFFAQTAQELFRN